MAVHFHAPPERPAEPARQGPDLPEQDILVDGTPITAREVAAEMQHHPADTAEAAWNAAAQALVIRRLLQDAAAARGLDPEDDGALDALLEAEITVPALDEAAARRWHAAHPERFGAPDLWEASHILIAADPEDEAERVAALARAEEILAQVQADPDSLPALARLHSACPSRDQGGHLGQVARGSTVPEFETVLASLSPGQVCPVVVKSRYGMHVVQLHAHAPATRTPYEAVADRVAADLRAQAWRAAVRQYIAVLAGRARIEGFDFAAADGPLVQ
ncbi:peptidylprolyl isomerase [Neoroseomonas oryzicola]|uniref:Parvulin-like PPIase n=1 Tax=Neoroseomonas oryzicola TaxID=535904 RepID=A0A9X9WNR8_9PROT|nr:peptidylprolyl isomerase [Neoroseomonas oryzicola]MBR0661978.1 peptidylprolyl isomerase [Neoroseomonas oryzicola]NKE17971.1 peptidylprolyl isomerase [Neoroseomonas oryzicola]